VSAPQISVVIPARDAAATLRDTLEGLREQSFDGPFDVLVVDDGSRDETAQIAAASGIVDHVIDAAGSGPAAARNEGAVAARSSRLAFLDADCRPTPGWLRAGAAALDSAELVLGETRPRPDRPHGPFDRSLWVIGGSPLFESANLFVRRELFDRLGGFESWLGPEDGKELGEDVWFGWRARRAGAEVSACPAALVHHEVYRRGIAGFVGERLRLRFFPALAARVPELRREFFYRRVFLSRRTAAFDAALGGLLLAVISGRRLPAVAALPYLRLLYGDLHESSGVAAAGGRLVADAVGFGALLSGSARHRSLLL
jgi:glycosyltransferase involved in cell wall biosynthesis